jgi:hypothetical protein
VIVFNSAVVNAMMMKNMIFLLKFVVADIEIMKGIVRQNVSITANWQSVTITECAGKNAHRIFLIVIMVCVLIVP